MNFYDSDSDWERKRQDQMSPYAKRQRIQAAQDLYADYFQSLFFDDEECQTFEDETVIVTEKTESAEPNPETPMDVKSVSSQ